VDPRGAILLFEAEGEHVDVLVVTPTDDGGTGTRSGASWTAMEMTARPAGMGPQTG
jgi:hypothetical protein